MIALLDKNGAQILKQVSPSHQKLAAESMERMKACYHY